MKIVGPFEAASEEQIRRVIPNSWIFWHCQKCGGEEKEDITFTLLT